MDKIEEVLTRGVDTVYPTQKALEDVLRSGKKIRLYQGFDPTGIQLHIGHMVGLMKLKQFQDLGHHVIFLIGDGTGQAGDPSGKKRSREKYLSLPELKKNAQDYVKQASKIVRFEGDNPAEIVYNSSWLNKLSLVELLDIANHFTLQQLEERDLYQERKKQNQDINFREFLYPLLQGYDSVALDVDLEIGGSDQMFNMLAGRKLVREMKNKEKYVLTTPLLTDSSGNKIGKTEGNVIALTSAPNDLYGMIMSLPDDVITKCFEYLTDIPMEDVEKIKTALKNGDNPMTWKKKLAYELTAILSSKDEAKQAQEFFESTFQKRALPQDIPTLTIPVKDSMTIRDAVVLKGKIVASNNEFRRLLQDGAVEMNGTKVTDLNQLVPDAKENTLKIGKHKFLKIIRQ